MRQVNKVTRQKLSDSAKKSWARRKALKVNESDTLTPPEFDAMVFSDTLRNAEIERLKTEAQIKQMQNKLDIIKRVLEL